ncbi:MAG: NAD-dependent protein deacetylase, partial [Propionibacteriales bacterium]|nr:NAD-dependent protein deacetylase [Propionibacteriales bacterium]
MSIVKDPSLRRIPSDAAPAPHGDVGDLADFVARHPRMFVVTGAGVSTGSGIPDYRDRFGDWKRQRPVQYHDFMTESSMRARYWARSLVGWRSFHAAVPNAAHVALARLEQAGRLRLLVTQNVDGLHQAAGSRRVIDLHGRLDRVICMSCRQTSPRGGWQLLLEDSNAAWVGLGADAAPDGDADLDDLDFSEFTVPPCPRCGGVVKPDVVFFGENVPPWRHTQAVAALATSDALLVVGSSLMVYSGYRYAAAAARMAKPVVAVNIGRTRADHLFGVKVAGDVGDTLSDL